MRRTLVTIVSLWMLIMNVSVSSIAFADGGSSDLDWSEESQWLSNLRMLELGDLEAMSDEMYALFVEDRQLLSVIPNVMMHAVPIFAIGGVLYGIGRLMRSAGKLQRGLGIAVTVVGFMVILAEGAVAYSRSMSVDELKAIVPEKTADQLILVQQLLVQIKANLDQPHYDAVYLEVPQAYQRAALSPEGETLIAFGSDRDIPVTTYHNSQFEKSSRGFFNLLSVNGRYFTHVSRETAEALKAHVWEQVLEQVAVVDFASITAAHESHPGEVLDVVGLLKKRKINIPNVIFRENAAPMTSVYAPPGPFVETVYSIQISDLVLDRDRPTLLIHEVLP